MNISNISDFEPVGVLQSYGTLSAALIGYNLTVLTLFKIKQLKLENGSARILAQKLMAHLLAFIIHGFLPLIARHLKETPSARVVQYLEYILFCLTYGIALHCVGVLVYLLSIVVYPTLHPYNSRRLETVIRVVPWTIPLTLMLCFGLRNQLNESCTPSIFSHFDIAFGLFAITFFLWIMLIIAIKEKLPSAPEFSSRIIAEHASKIFSKGTAIMGFMLFQILPYWKAADGQHFGISCDLDFKWLTHYSAYSVMIYSMDHVLLYCYHDQLRAWMISNISRLFRFERKNQTEQNGNSMEMTNVA